MVLRPLYGKDRRRLKPEAFLEPITENTFRTLEENPHKVPDAIQKEIKRLAGQYQFFHWHLAFPDVFRPNGDHAPPTTKAGQVGSTSYLETLHGKD